MEHPTTPWSAGWTFCLVAPIRALPLIHAGAPGWHCPCHTGLASPTSKAWTLFPSMIRQTCLCVWEGERGARGLLQKEKCQANQQDSSLSQHSECQAHLAPLLGSSIIHSNLERAQQKSTASMAAALWCPWLGCPSLQKHPDHAGDGEQGGQLAGNGPGFWGSFC